MRITKDVDVEKLPVPGEFWKRPEPKASGDESYDAILQAVGSALTAWENLENDFARLFGMLCSGSPPFSSPAAQRAYGAIASNSGRRDAMVAAAEVHFNLHTHTKEAPAKFARLMAHFQQGSSRRNEIAHGYAVHYEVDGRDLGSFLIPPEYNSRKTSVWTLEAAKAAEAGDSFAGLRVDYRYTSGDIVGFAAKFALLRNSVLRFSAYDIGSQNP